jgi:phosphoglycerate dehydrogenase-like enzyme
MRILFCDSTFPDAPEFLRQRLPGNAKDEIIVSTEKDIRSMLDGVDVVIPKMRRIDRDLMDAGSFRLVQQWGAGIEGVDLAAALARNIWVSNVPSSGGNAESVAEHAILLILSLLRKMPLALSNAGSGVIGAPLGSLLAGRTVCLYGLGAIALAIAKRLKTFGVRLIGITRDTNSSKLQEFGLDQYVSVSQRDTCLTQADILVLCVRYTEDMRNMIGAHELACLPSGAYLVNVARGGLINNRALHTALINGQLAGAGLDVFWQEPFPVNDPILTLPNVIATPHIGGVTRSGYNDISEAVAANIERLRNGEPPLNRLV